MGKGDLNNGFYVDYGKMIPGAGWLSVGPGYRQVVRQGHHAARRFRRHLVERLPHAPRRASCCRSSRSSRLALGTHVRWVDFGDVDYFGVGPDTVESAKTQFGIAGHARRRARQAAADALVRHRHRGRRAVAVARRRRARPDRAVGGQPTFMPAADSDGVDTRNFREHPTKGVLLRGAASHYDDRDTGAFTHQRYEGGDGRLHADGRRTRRAGACTAGS